MMTNKQRAAIAAHKESLLCRYPVDTIAVINGRPWTRQDKVQAHRENNARHLADILRDRIDQGKPCFVWTFYNNSFVYRGWWLYVVTHKNSWHVRRDCGEEMTLKIMRLFSCGVLPLIKVSSSGRLLDVALRKDDLL
jgi:hypothetical protein